MKKLFVALAALGLLAALVAPVSAAELKAGGQLRSKHFVTNAVGTAQINSGLDTDKAHGTTTRANLFFHFIGNEYSKIVWNIEMDYNWGDKGYNTGRNTGGGLSTDTTNAETKSLYFDVAVPETPVSFRVGAQSWYDPWGGGLSIMDAPGIRTMISMGDTKVDVGYFMFWDDTFSSVVDDVSFWRLQGSHKISPAITVDGHFWYLKDGSGHSGGNGFLTNPDGRGAGEGNIVQLQHNQGYTNAADRGSILPAGTHYDADFFYLGAEAKGVVGPVKYGVVGLYQFGNVDVNEPSSVATEPDVSAFFLQGLASMNLPIAQGGSAGLHVTYVSGTDNEASSRGAEDIGLITLSNYQLAGAWYYGPGMMILVPDGDAINTGQNFLAYDINNIWEDQFLGILLVTANGTVKLPMNLTGRVAVGAMWSAEDRAVNGESYMGTEINGKLTYQIAPAATIEINGAFAFIGDDFYEVTPSEAAAAQATLGKEVRTNDSADDLYWFSTVFRVRI